MHTKKLLHITFDPFKNQRSIAQRGLSFADVADFDFQSALFWMDVRKAYSEPRICGLGLLEGRLYALVFTETSDGLRVISFRKANSREIKRYEQETGS